MKNIKKKKVFVYDYEIVMKNIFRNIYIFHLIDLIKIFNKFLTKFP